MYKNINERLNAMRRASQWKEESNKLTVDILKQVFEKSNGKCLYCKKKITIWDFSLDHKIPFALKGNNNKSNLAACCLKCNINKSIKSVKEYLKELKAITSI